MTEHDEQLAAYVRGIMARDGATADALGRTHAAAVRFKSAAVSSRGFLPEELESLQKVERGQPLSAAEGRSIKAVVLPNGLRPAFDVVDDSFAELPGTWRAINERRGMLETMIRGIGRLNVSGLPSLPFAGTAFVVAPDLLLTNRHVAEYFVDRAGAGASLQFKAGMASVLDLKQEVGSDASIPVRVTGPAVVLTSWDAALLRIEPLPGGVHPLPLAGGAPGAVEGRLAVVVGYPALDPASDLVEQIQIYRGTFDKKRLMPGRLMGFKQTTSYDRAVVALGHDCTTLGGNSGSAVIDVATGTVAGLHFAGDYLVANYAVPSWELARDPAVASLGVPFV